LRNSTNVSPLYHGTVQPRVADGGDGLQIMGIYLISRSGQPTRVASNLWFGQRLTIPHRKHQSC
jgi:hypothetical protein